MKSETYTTATEEETIGVGRSLGPQLSGVVLLIGNLGAGKTTFAKGIVESRGVAKRNDVSSPTFTLVHQYGDADADTPPVFHIDLYRLDEEHEVETLGLHDLFASSSLVLLEWAERFPRLLPARRTEIRIEALPNEARSIQVLSFGTEGDL